MGKQTSEENAVNHEELYKKMTNVMPVDEFLEKYQSHTDAQIKALGVLSGKRYKDFHSSLELLTDALITYRLTSGTIKDFNPKQRYMMYNDVYDFIQAFAQKNEMDPDDIESSLKQDKGKKFLDAMIENEQNRHIDRDISYRMRKHMPATDDGRESIVKYHNSTLKKEDQMTKYMVGKLADPNAFLDFMKDYHMRSLKKSIKNYRP